MKTRTAPADILSSNEQEIKGESNKTLDAYAFGHEVALVIDKTAAAIQLDGGIAVAYFEMQELGVVLGGNPFGKRQQFRANSPPSIGTRYEQLVNPGPLSAIFEAVIEADNEVGNRARAAPAEIDDPEDGVLQQLAKGVPHFGLIERFGPRIILLHLDH
jgi:hypothetical protein